MTIDALDLNRRSWFIVEIAIPVHILTDMAVSAMHAGPGVHVIEMYTLLEPLGIVCGNALSTLIQHIALKVCAVHDAKDPDVTMEITELRALRFGIDVRPYLLQKIAILSPQPA